MKVVFAHLKKYTRDAILGPVFKLLEAIFELLVPLVVAYIIDTGIKNDDAKAIIISFVILMVFSISGFILAVIAQYFSARAAVGVSTSLRSSIFKKIQSLSYSELDELGTSSLITRMTSDVNQVQVGINLTLRLLLRSPIVVFGALIMAFIVNAQMALIFLVVILILSIVVFGIMYLCIPLYKKSQNKLDSVTLSTRENLVGARVIRAFTKEEKEIKSFTEKNNDYTRFQKIVGAIAALMNPLTYGIINAGIISLIYFGAVKISAGNLTQGQLVALYNYMSIILVELVKLANLIITVNKAIACSNRISAVLDYSSSLKKEENMSESSSFIELKNVSLKYHSTSANSLNNISFKVNKGETVGIIGGTGSGKTSLINLLPHFYDVTEGEVIINGKNVNSYEDNNLRKMFGIVPQKAVLFSGTIKSNLKWGNEDASDEDIMDAIIASQAEEVIFEKENGIDSIVNEGGSNFSGGQKQRLCIARALVRKPEILILDDSCSALDYATDARVRIAIKNLEYKPTTFIVSQRTSSIMNADKIIVLDEGKVVGMGNHEELLKSCQVYKEIHESQIKNKEDIFDE